MRIEPLTSPQIVNAKAREILAPRGPVGASESEHAVADAVLRSVQAEVKHRTPELLPQYLPAVRELARTTWRIGDTKLRMRHRNALVKILKPIVRAMPRDSRDLVETVRALARTPHESETASTKTDARHFAKLAAIVARSGAPLGQTLAAAVSSRYFASPESYAVRGRILKTAAKDLALQQTFTDAMQHETMRGFSPRPEYGDIVESVRIRESEPIHGWWTPSIKRFDS